MRACGPHNFPLLTLTALPVKENPTLTHIICSSLSLCLYLLLLLKLPQLPVSSFSNSSKLSQHSIKAALFA